MSTFLQHENLLHAVVVIRATNNRNLQQNICCETSCKKMALSALIYREQHGGERCMSFGVNHSKKLGQMSLSGCCKHQSVIRIKIDIITGDYRPGKETWHQLFKEWTTVSSG